MRAVVLELSDWSVCSFDTCVWLDVAKNQQQQATLGVLEQLVERGAVTLIIQPSFEINLHGTKPVSSKKANAAFRLLSNVRRK
jgi:hypothetical protein